MSSCSRTMQLLIPKCHMEISRTLGAFLFPDSVRLILTLTKLNLWPAISFWIWPFLSVFIPSNSEKAVFSLVISSGNVLIIAPSWLYMHRFISTISMWADLCWQWVSFWRGFGALQNQLKTRMLVFGGGLGCSDICQLQCKPSIDGNDYAYSLASRNWGWFPYYLFKMPFIPVWRRVWI